MPRPIAVLTIVATLLLSLLSACGSDNAKESGAADKATATGAKTTATAAKNATVVARCHEAFDPFLAELRQLNIDAPTAEYEAYRAATRKLKSDYQAFDVKAIPKGSCQGAVGGPAAGAYAMHITASEAWAKCLKRGSCDATMAKLKQQWSKASELTDAADKAFGTVSTT